MQGSSCHNPTSRYPFLFASGFATSRACSMKSFATGLSVRFFRVTIPFGTRAIGSSMGYWHDPKPNLADRVRRQRS
jgi:hypothetical protein